MFDLDELRFHLRKGAHIPEAQSPDQVRGFPELKADVFRRMGVGTQGDDLAS